MSKALWRRKGLHSLANLQIKLHLLSKKKKNNVHTGKRQMILVGEATELSIFGV